MHNTILNGSVCQILLIKHFPTNVYLGDFLNLVCNQCNNDLLQNFLKYTYNICLLTVALAKVSEPRRTRTSNRFLKRELLYH